MEKFVIEDALYLFESIKENKMISYDDNLINSSNNKINNDKLAYIGKNIKGFDGLDSSSILSLKKFKLYIFLTLCCLINYIYFTYILCKLFYSI